jgi:asparagine synthase (glutamine-hydrolysing)
MCGITGFTRERGSPSEDAAQRLRRMTASLRHRGPDAQRGLLLEGVALGHTRLAIVDLEGGAQPMRDEATGVTVVFNGEVFNHHELRAQLEGGHAFRTHSDTEVLLAAYLARGIDCVQDFNGQFAFALWDPRDATLWLARDRVGIAPLFYAQLPGGGLAFGSEAKALFAGGLVQPSLDARALKQALQLWSPVPPRTAFEGVSVLPPACVARWRAGMLQTWRYWDVDFPAAAEAARAVDERSALQTLGELLEDSVRLRLRADVPVAAYLSGGLDSSLVCALAQAQLGGTLRTFSVGFTHAGFDERRFQQQVVASLGTAHHSLELEDGAVGALVPGAVWHGEQVMMRSAPAPFLALSQRVRAQGTKVVLTGEGADELFWGYDLFKETKVRQFWARFPGSQLRPRLLRRLYPSLAVGQRGAELLR